MAGNREHVSCGLDINHVPDLNGSLDEAGQMGYDFICVPIVNPRFRRELCVGPAKERTGALTRSDLLLASNDWSSLIVAKLSKWIQTDSADEMVRKNSEKALIQELRFASHLSVPALLVALTGPNNVNLARVLNDHILQGHNHQIWVQVPMKAPIDQLDSVFEPENSMNGEENSRLPQPSPFTEDTWTWWNTFRVMCDSSKRLGVCLEITADLPSAAVIERWLGEPVKSAMLNTSIFLSNRQGYPVLSRAHQALIKSLYKLDIQVIITGLLRHTDKGMKTYQQYLDHIWQHQDPLDNLEKFAKGYEDFLQCPLQPLKDNLESQTYEVFEKDPIKYSQYQKAVFYALMDRVPPEEKDTKVIIVMVLGAGRGPLVRASIQAADKADRRIRVYAVEKNPNAIVTLMNLKEELWGDKVTVVSSDMRVWEAPEKADIIVSELLGSFGDNELSPECLDGAEKFLKEDGISIPASYTSYLAPLMSTKLWNEARTCKDPNKNPDAPYETPYVVRLHNVHLLDIPQPLFTFQHPNKAGTDNSRYGILDFTTELDSVLHGFAGYFDCVLYGDVNLSIVPQTHSPGMFSWFPLYIPIKEPMALFRGDRLTVHMWRVCNERSVWYEWCVTDPYTRPIHNPRGRSYTIDL